MNLVVAAGIIIVTYLVRVVLGNIIRVMFDSGKTEDELGKSYIFNGVVMGYLISSIVGVSAAIYGFAYMVAKYVL